MSEQGDQGKPKVDLHALGGHVIQGITEHTERHESNKITSERLKHLGELSKRTHYIAAAEGIRGNTTRGYHVETLDTGTNVSAAVNSGRGALRETANRLVSKSEGTLGARYLKDGALSQRYKEQALDEGAVQSNSLTTGLNIQLILTTPHEMGDPTSDGVHVGMVLDPESILIPLKTENSDQPETVFNIIGPDDERFTPIMDVLSRVNEEVGSWGEKPHVG